MEYLRLKCPTRKRDPEETDGPVEVTLSQFAALGGLTEKEYSKRMFELLQSGELLKLLKPEASCDLSEWIADGPLGTGEEFVVLFRLSKNRPVDAALYCVCSVDLEGMEPVVYVRHAIHGIMDAIPAEARGLEGFELNLCDLEATI